MSLMKVECLIKTYPEESSVKPEDVIIRNHWNFTDRVHIKIGDKEFTVLAADLTRAITNCCNHRT